MNIYIYTHSKANRSVLLRADPPDPQRATPLRRSPASASVSSISAAHGSAAVSAAVSAQVMGPRRSTGPWSL